MGNFKIKNLNEDIYKRFGVEIEAQEAQDAFCVFFKNTFFDILDPIVSPTSYEGADELRVVQTNIIAEFARATFRDKNHYLYVFDDREFKTLFNDIFAESSFNKIVANLQIFINILFKHYKWSEKDEFIDEIEKYLEDFPVLSLRIKKYKRKAPQFFPTRTHYFDKQILTLIGELEDGNYEESLKHFELGIKSFAQAKSKAELKKVVDDMHSSIDEFIKSYTGDKNKSFRSIFKGSNEYKKFGIKSKKQKEIFKNLKDIMDSIKHGADKEFDKWDIDTVINITASLLSLLLKREYNPKNSKNIR